MGTTDHFPYSVKLICPGNGLKNFRIKGIQAEIQAADAQSDKMLKFFPVQQGTVGGDRDIFHPFDGAQLFKKRENIFADKRFTASDPYFGDPQVAGDSGNPEDFFIPGNFMVGDHFEW